MVVIDEIPCSEWPKLRDLYSAQTPELNGFMLLSNFIKWTTNSNIAENDEFVKCYALDGDWRNDGTFILIHKYPGNIEVYFNTLSADLTRLTKALCCLRVPSNGDADVVLIDYFAFDGYPERLRPAVFEFVRVCDVRFYRDLIEYEYLSYRVDKQHIAKYTIELPTGITLGALQLKHAEQINDAWPYRHSGSLQQIQNKICSNMNVGAFDESSNLIAWCLRTRQGSIGLLEVTKEHKRRGIGAALVCRLAQLISADGDEVLTQIASDNDASRGLFEKLGFRIVGKVHWTQLKL